MKKINFLVFAALLLPVTTHAKFVNGDAKNLMECNGLVHARFGEVDFIKAANIKSKARSFTVKYKVVNDGERSKVQCKLAKGEVAVVSCLKGDICTDAADTALVDQ